MIEKQRLQLIMMQHFVKLIAKSNENISCVENLRRLFSYIHDHIHILVDGLDTKSIQTLAESISNRTQVVFRTVDDPYLLEYCIRTNETVQMWKNMYTSGLIG